MSKRPHRARDCRSFILRSTQGLRRANISLPKTLIILYVRCIDHDVVHLPWTTRLGVEEDDDDDDDNDDDEEEEDVGSRVRDDGCVGEGTEENKQKMTRAVDGEK